MLKSERIIKIYGQIYRDNENCAAWIVNDIEYYKSKGCDIVICLHCYGGDVIEGNLIASAIAKSGATIRIEGLAASMAAFMLPYAAKVEMVDNGFVMLHEPRLTTGGTADELEKSVKLLRDITADFVAKLMGKTGKDEETVRSWLVGENWFTAAEAKAMGLVDEIIPSIVAVNITTDNELNSEIIYSRFSAQLIINNKKEMDKSQIIARCGLTEVTGESSDADVLAALESKLSAEKLAREQKEAELSAEKSAREAAEAIIAAERQRELDDIVSKAISEKRITADKKDIFLNIGKNTGIEALKTAIEAIPVTVFNRLSAMTGKTEEYVNGSVWDARQNEIRGIKN